MEFRDTYEPLAGISVGDDYLRQATVRGFFTNRGDLIGGYVLNTKPDFRYFGYVPEHARSQLPLQAGRESIAEITCIWMIRHGRPPLLRYKVYTQVVLDALGTKATYILGSTNAEQVRQIQQRVMKHDLWHGIDTNSKERWLYYAKRRELIWTFVSALISDVIKRGGNLRCIQPPRGATISIMRRRSVAQR